MSSSWNFPSWAKPSYLVSKPSRAKVGHFNFLTEVKLWFFLIYSFFTSFLFSSINFWTSHFLKKNCYSLQKTTENRVKMKKVFWKRKNILKTRQILGNKIRGFVDSEVVKTYQEHFIYRYLFGLVLKEFRQPLELQNLWSG